MRFEGSQVIAAPMKFVARALRDPAVLEASIPHCTRIEAQPGYRPDQNGEVILGFEVGTANPQTGAEPIVGWIEAADLTIGAGLHYALTLDDGITRVRAHGTIKLIGRDHDQQTELRYTLEAGVAGQRDSAWSASAIAQAERSIGHFLMSFMTLVESPDFSLPGITLNGDERPGTGAPQVLVETKRGQVVLVPAHPVPSPTQGMLRRLREGEATRWRQTRLLWSLGGVAIVSAALAAWQLTRIVSARRTTRG